MKLYKYSLALMMGLCTFSSCGDKPVSYTHLTLPTILLV